MTDQGETPRLANVLLVEDNDADIALTRAMLDYEAVELILDAVEDGDHALDYLRRAPPYENAPRPDLILMDLNLPRVDGMTVIGEMRRHAEWRTIPVVVLSGMSRRAPQTAEAEGIAGYIGKPIHYSCLQTIVEKLPGLAFETADKRHCLRRLDDD